MHNYKKKQTVFNSIFFNFFYFNKSIHPFFHLPLFHHLLTFIMIHFPVIHPSIHQFIYPFIQAFIYSSNHSFIYPTIHPAILPTIHPTSHPATELSHFRLFGSHNAQNNRMRASILITTLLRSPSPSLPPLLSSRHVTALFFEEG